MNDSDDSLKKLAQQYVDFWQNFTRFVLDSEKNLDQDIQFVKQKTH